MSDKKLEKVANDVSTTMWRIVRAFVIQHGRKLGFAKFALATGVTARRARSIYDRTCGRICADEHIMALHAAELIEKHALAGLAQSAALKLELASLNPKGYGPDAVAEVNDGGGVSAFGECPLPSRRVRSGRSKPTEGARPRAQRGSRRPNATLWGSGW